MDFEDLVSLLIFTLILPTTIVECSSSSDAFPCISKSFGSSSYVCVCNSTYCDTVEPDVRPPPNHVVSYVSSSNMFRLKRFVFPLKQATKKTGSPKVKFTIEDDFYKQTIVGFGGTFTDAAGMNFASLPEGAQNLLIDSYFGPNGIEYTLGRIPIASNDMSTDIYSYDFTRGDTGLTKFTIAGYDHQFKLPYIDKAVVSSKRNISLFASPWSSPDWMKTNEDMVEVGTIAPNMSKVYANYLGRFLQEYESFMFHGRMWGITPQSGPARSCDNTSQPVYQSLCWLPEQMRDWVVNELKPSLKAYGYDYIKLLVMDDNRDVIPHWMQAFYDVQAIESIDGFAVQGYHDDKADPSLLSDLHSQYKDKILIGSEFCIRENPVVELGSWERAIKLANSIFQDMDNYVSGFTHYNLAVDTSGGPSWVHNYADSPIIVDAKNQVFYKQPMFYIMGHFSKFVPPGSKAIKLSASVAGTSDIPAVAFLRPDGCLVMVLNNDSADEIDISILHRDFTFDHTLDAWSITTAIFWNTTVPYS